MSRCPASWVTVDMGAVGILHCGQSPKAATVNSDGVGKLYVTGPEQWNGSRISKSKWTTDPKRVVPDGCVFITVKGAGVGKTFPGISCAIGRDVYAFQPSDEIDFSFILQAIQFSVNEIISQARGDIPGLSNRVVKKSAAQH